MRSKLNWWAAVAALAAVLGLGTVPMVAAAAPQPIMAAHSHKKHKKSKKHNKKTKKSKKSKKKMMY
ncbi:MAG: hypothetical protein ACRD2E_11735 [Terriglobales bacterium]